MRATLYLLFLPLLLIAQPEFYGYFESEADLMQVGVTNYSLGYNKLRLDIESRPNDNILIGANINVQQYWGQTTWNLLDFFPQNIWKPALQDERNPPEYWIDNLPLTIQDTLILDNLYMRISFPWLDLTLGRQQLSPGVGYAWNPTDIFNTKTLLDPSYEQTGVHAIRTEIPLADRVTINSALQIQDNWKNSTKQVSFKTGVGSFDLELTAAEFIWSRSYFSMLGLKTATSQRSMYGGSFVGELMGWGVWAEGAQNILALEDDFVEIVLGIDHTFDNSVYVLLEVLHNENGAANQEAISFDSYLQGFGGETHSLMQDYAFVYLMHQTFDYISFSAIAFANLNDQSGTFGPQLEWNLFEDTNLSAQTSLSWGDNDTEFGLQDWAVRLRLLSSF